jgi:hypothetical protein
MNLEWRKGETWWGLSHDICGTNHAFYSPLDAWVTADCEWEATFLYMPPTIYQSKDEAMADLEKIVREMMKQ